MAEIIYTYNNKPYLNLTNRCPCACKFCIRAVKDSVGSAETLWHDSDPAWDDIRHALESSEALFFNAGEAVFCGYGEPMCAFENLKKAARWLKERFPNLALRVNTNGLGDLINESPTAHELKGLIDTVSISLNAPNAQRYHELVRPRFGEGAFCAMLHFARDCRECIPNVKFTVVDVLTPVEIEECQLIADKMGIPLRVRTRA